MPIKDASMLTAQPLVSFSTHLRPTFFQTIQSRQHHQTRGEYPHVYIRVSQSFSPGLPGPQTFSEMALSPNSPYILAKTFTHLHCDSVNTITTSPDQEYVASGAADGSVAIVRLVPRYLRPTTTHLVRRYDAPAGLLLGTAPAGVSALAWGLEAGEPILFVAFLNGQIFAYEGATTGSRVRFHS